MSLKEKQKQVVNPKSVVNWEGTEYALLSSVEARNRLVVSGNTADFIGQRNGATLICDCSPENAAVLRLRLPWLNPAPLGTKTSFAELSKHTIVMHHFNCYKLSIHTGSDKFSIYDLIDQYAKGWVHVKTAGTSYLEALRVISWRFQ